MKLQKIIERYVLPVGNIGMLIATIVLLILTVKYLGFTKDMANMMEKEFQIKLEPVVEIFYKSCVLSSTLELGTDFIVTNKGSYLVTLIDYRLESWHGDFDYFNICPLERIFNKPLSPNESFKVADHSISLAELKKLKLQGIEKHPIFTEITFNFWDIRGNKFSKNYKCRTILDKII